MFSEQLKAFLSSETSKTDFAYRSATDMAERFESLRGCALIPRGRDTHRRHLETKEIVAGLLSIVPDRPSYAGFSAIILKKLRPVGGNAASFNQSPCFGDVLSLFVEDAKTLDELIHLSVSISEMYINGHGRAVVHYRRDGEERTAYYVGELATSLMQPNAEKNYNPAALTSSVVKETVLYPEFFHRLKRAMAIKYVVAESLIHENNTKEDQKETRNLKLGIRPGSSFLNVGVSCQVTWPREEAVADFEGYKIILMPKTKQNTTSLHIDLSGNKLSYEEAFTLLNRFLSVMTWCDDQFSAIEWSWSGNPVPVPVPKTDLAFNTAYHWFFARKLPMTAEARRALAIYREGRTAHQNHMIPYAVLAYSKLIELKHKGGMNIKYWFAQNLEHLRKNPNLTSNFADFEKSCGSSSPEEYLWAACRCAVAHANDPYKSTDPDDADELKRLHVAADVLRALARVFITSEFNISDCIYDGT